MSKMFQLSCESTVDLPYSYIAGRGISVLFYTYSIGDQVYEDDMCRDPKALDQFYQFISEGNLPSTSQINTFRYTEYFRELLAKGDVLHLAFGSGMTPSVNNAKEAAAQVQKEFPDRKIIVLDSYASCGGYGLLVDDAADRWEAGQSIEEVAAWAEENCKKIYHQFYATDLKHFRRGGRVSGPTAAIGTVLGICPTMCLDDMGKIYAYGKARGKKAAVKELMRVLEENVRNGKDYDGKCFINHSHCPEDAQVVLEQFKAFMPKATFRVEEIGTIIASHTGQGTVAVFFWGDHDRPGRKN